jgi:hypothetical protein
VPRRRNRQGERWFCPFGVAVVVFLAIGAASRSGAAANAGCARMGSASAWSVATAFNSSLHPPDARAVVDATADPSAPSFAGSISSSYRLLMMRGWSATEAGNVVAYIAGPHATVEGWSIRQVKQLVTLRSLVACGVIAS